MQSKVLIIYTGGTIGMAEDATTHALVPFNFDYLLESMPSLKKLNVEIDSFSFDKIIDSSDMNPQYWIDIANVIYDRYEQYDGFVVLHGTDTMSYTASALSFMFENLTKPVILTGSQLPLGVLRSDGKDNLLNSVEIAAAHENGKAIVPEVCIFFENNLYRGNRTTKLNAENFNAFYSGNYPILANIGVHIKFDKANIHQVDDERKTKLYTKLENKIGILKMHPGLSKRIVESILDIEELKGLVLETYGSGNAPSFPWFEEYMKKAIDRGMTIVNISQCKTGGVEMGKYESSIRLLNAGVLSGYDMTTEAAVCKLMVVLGSFKNNADIKLMLETPLCGEMTSH
jgi:L-asparaginase